MKTSQTPQRQQPPRLTPTPDSPASTTPVGPMPSAPKLKPPFQQSVTVGDSQINALATYRKGNQEFVYGVSVEVSIRANGKIHFDHTKAVFSKLLTDGKEGEHRDYALLPLAQLQHSTQIPFEIRWLIKGVLSLDEIFRALRKETP